MTTTRTLKLPTLSELKKGRCGFSLAGGSLKGIAAHTGFIKAMLELGIQPEAIIGTSAGSIIGAYTALYGLNEESVQDMLNIVTNLKAKDYLDKVSILVLLWRLFFNSGRRISGFIKGEKLEFFLNRIFNYSHFSDCKIPFYAHVVNLNRAREEIIETHSLAKACRASAAIPLVFQPTRLPDGWYLDGGVCGLQASEELAKRHPELDYIIVNDFHQHDERYRPIMNKPFLPISLIFRLYDAVANEFENLRTEWLENYNMQEIDIRPSIIHGVNLQNPNKDDLSAIIDSGYNETLRLMSELKDV
jgi:predicted acylesterase/phospholipase RssA